MQPLQYCPTNVSMAVVWFNHGISQCFLDTVSMATIGGFLLLFGTIQLIMYRRHGTEISPTQILPSKMYAFQLFLLVLLPILAVIRFILEGFVFDGAQVYGFMIVSICVTLFMYPYSILLLVKERYYLLPSIPTRGHGLVLVIFDGLRRGDRGSFKADYEHEKGSRVA